MAIKIIGANGLSPYIEDDLHGSQKPFAIRRKAN